MNKKNIPIIILIIVIIGFAFYIFTADTIFAKEEDKYKVELITVLTSAYDQFTTQVMTGVYNVKKDDVAEVTFTLVDTSEKPDKYFQKSVESGTDLICSIGYTMQSPLYDAAVKNPNTKFFTVDMSFEDDRPLPDNLANILFRSNEASYVAGYVAGMTTETNIIGFVGAIDYSIVREFYYGFAAGIALAENEKGQKITIIDKYVGSFADPYTGSELAKDIYNSDADIIFSVAGFSGDGVISTAALLNKYVIGVDTDQNYMAPENVIFSVTKEIDDMVYKTVLDYIDNPNAHKGVISVGYAEKGVDVVSYLDIIDKNVIAKADLLEQDIIDGRIVVPCTLDEYNSYISGRS